MSLILPLPSPQPHSVRTITRTDTGAQTSYTRTLSGGGQITGGAALEKGEDGLTADVSRTGPGGRTLTMQREVPSETVDAYREYLTHVADRLRDRLGGQAD